MVRTAAGEAVLVRSPDKQASRRERCGPALVQLHELTRDRAVGISVKELFRSLQVGGEFADGVISRKEWQIGLHSLGLEVTPQEADDVFDLADPDHSGTINFDELGRAMRSARDARYGQIMRTGEANDPILDEAGRACFITTLSPPAQGEREATRDGYPARRSRPYATAAEAEAEAKAEDEARAAISAQLVTGEGAPLGEGGTRELLQGWRYGVGLGKGALVAGSRIQLAPPMGTTRAELYSGGGWPRRLAHYADRTRWGVLVLTTSAAAVRRWAFDPACQQEVELVPEGRLFIWLEGTVVAFRRDAPCATVGEGRGHVYTPAGELYEGELHEAQFHGRGRLSQPGGAWYEGEFRHHLKHGRGTTVFMDGGGFVGEYEKGERHGMGRVFAPREDPTNGQVTPGGRYLVADGFWECGRYRGS